MVRVGGGLLLIALAVASLLIVAALLAVFGLVASLGAGVGVLLAVASLVEGIGGGLLFLRWHVCPGERTHPASLLEHEPQVAYPQDHVDEAEGHRRVESGDLGLVALTAAVLLLVTRRDEGDDPLWIGGCFHVRQAFRPSARRDEPHEGKHRRHHKVDLGALAVFTVLLQNEAVDGEGCHGVEEGKDGDGDEELGRGGIVPHQEQTLGVSSLAGGSVKVNLMEPEGILKFYFDT